LFNSDKTSRSAEESSEKALDVIFKILVTNVEIQGIGHVCYGLASK
jgi:hypothetical protein